MLVYSLIEFIVYGLIGYSGLLVLVFSVVTKPPTGRDLAGARAIWLVPSVICLFLISYSGGIISGDTDTTTRSEIGYNVTTGAVITNVTVTETVQNQITLQNPVWIMLHVLFAIILIIYIIIQLFNIFTKF